MNIKTLLHDIKNLVAAGTGYQEFSPRRQNDTGRQDAPNSGVFRVVVMGAGKTKHAGLNRYADLVVVIMRPLSGGDANKSNEDAAEQTEALISTLADYDGTEAQTGLEIDAELIRESGRMVSTVQIRVNYKLEATT